MDIKFVLFVGGVIIAAYLVNKFLTAKPTKIDPSPAPVEEDVQTTLNKDENIK